MERIVINGVHVDIPAAVVAASDGRALVQVYVDAAPAEREQILADAVLSLEPPAIPTPAVVAVSASPAAKA